jgi:Fe-S-cluster containining protein
MIGQTVFFNHPCKELAEDGKCKIYESRPRFCKSGYETHYAELKELGCKYQEDIPIAIDDGVLRIHVAEKVGSRERMM